MLLADTGIVSHAVTVLETHGEDAAVVLAALTTLRALTRANASVVMLATSATGIPWVLYTIRRHVLPGGVIPAAPSAEGGVRHVLDITYRHLAVAAIAAAGVAVLVNIASHNNGSTGVLVAAAGGLDVVVKAMATHADVGDVVERGCCALRNITNALPHGSYHAGYVSPATRMACVEALVAALRRFPAMPVVAVQANAALTNLGVATDGSGGGGPPGGPHGPRPTGGMGVPSGYPGGGGVPSGYPGGSGVPSGYPGGSGVPSGYPGGSGVPSGYPGGSGVPSGYPGGPAPPRMQQQAPRGPVGVSGPRPQALGTAVQARPPQQGQPAPRPSSAPAISEASVNNLQSMFPHIDRAIIFDILSSNGTSFAGP